MKLMIVTVLATLAVAQANYAVFSPYAYSYPYGYPFYRYVAPTAAQVVAAAPVPAVAPVATYAPAFTSTQYHAQDELGQASFGYAHPGQAAANYRDAHGNQVGSYAYISPEGKEIRVSYVADAAGFRVLSNALPEAPAVPEVAAAVLPVAPEPVKETPEVAAARAEHMAAVEEVKARNAAVAYSSEESNSRRKRQIFSYAPLPAVRYAAPFSYSYTLPYAHPFAYSLPVAQAAAPFRVAAPVAVAAAAPAAVPVREATLTKTVLNPNHAVAYRVD